MPKAQSQIKKGGKCLSTSENRKSYYKQYGSKHGLATRGHRFTESKEHRGCGPLAKYNRRKQIELAAIADRSDKGGLGHLPLTDESCRLLADWKKGIEVFW